MRQVLAGPVPTAGATLGHTLLHDLLPKVRQAAAVTISTLLEGPAQRAYLAIAECTDTERPTVRWVCKLVGLHLVVRWGRRLVRYLGLRLALFWKCANKCRVGREWHNSFLPADMWALGCHAAIAYCSNSQQCDAL